MANEAYPLLLFPAPSQAGRAKLPRGGGGVHLPSPERQRARIAPQLAALQRTFEEKRLRLQAAAPLENPELVLVLEVAGSLQGFAKAVAKVPGLEWLAERADEQFDPDDDFYADEERQKPVSGRMYLLGTNQQAHTQLLALWNRYQQNTDAPFDRGLAPFRNLFKQLRTVRHWDATDRVGSDVEQYWRECVDDGAATVRFEIEAWYFGAPDRNAAAHTEMLALVKALDGIVLDSAMIPEIAYHGFLVELPAPSIVRILAGEFPELLLSDRIMFFRPRAQSFTDSVSEAQNVPQPPAATAPQGPPIIALLDGLPLANHALLDGRLVVDDPDGMEAHYEAKDRVHGTAMASLILHGELDGTPTPLNHQLYVRPVLRPDPNDNFNRQRREHVPDNILLIDMIHRAVKRIAEGDAGQAPVAPTVRVISLSIGDVWRLFARDLSPWARLLDWLAFRYSLLFIVSAGNDVSPLALQTTANLEELEPPAREALAFTALVRENSSRRLVAPAEAMNVLTVGALHDDNSQPPVVPSRFDLFAKGGPSPLSRVGLGYRRSVKPDILMSGGRVLYSERMLNDPDMKLVDPLFVGRPPGHRVAIPPLPGQSPDQTAYCRGTSNAAALASRAAGMAFDVVEALRADVVNGLPTEFDAVLLKALLVHSANWGVWSERLLAERPAFQAITDANTRRMVEKDFVTRWLGYGPVNVDRALTCTDERATLIGVGEVEADGALVFSAPLPPGLAGRRVWRRLTLTLAWMTPINSANQAYRRAKLWVTPPQELLRVRRHNSVNDRAAVRGTVQHEILEGDDAVVFADGDRLVCKVNCAADAGELTDKIRFALCVSLEAAVESGIAVYQEIRERIALPVGIQPIAQ